MTQGWVLCSEVVSRDRERECLLINRMEQRPFPSGRMPSGTMGGCGKSGNSFKFSAHLAKCVVDDGVAN